ncbi:MAG: chromosome segregation protein SMC [Acidobacteriota bacterium]
MLKLDKMELIGFKSFLGKTQVVFPDGITAVVGPNGCGKSNIGDAISWVLGEQSVKSLRGVKMEDVIFNGCESKKPLGMAEVSLKLVSDNGSVGNGTEEIILTRRLFRSGESEYILNGERCRLKDIRNLLSQIHIGVRTCAVIEQGRVEEIMNARPVERRLLIEEAAGILGYKSKRMLAEMKLEATKANLLRVQDIFAEVERQMNSLRRQASKARRFARLSEEKRRKQSLLFVLRHTNLEAELSGIDSSLLELKVKEAEILAQIGSLEAALEKGKQELSSKESDLSSFVETEHRLDKEMASLEARVRSSEEKIAELESAILRLVRDRESFSSDMAGADAIILEKEKDKRLHEIRRDEVLEKIGAREEELRRSRERESHLNRLIEERREELIRIAQSLAEQRNSMKGFEAGMGKIESTLQRRRKEEDEEARQMKLWTEELASLDAGRRGKEEQLQALRSELESMDSRVEFLREELKGREKLLSEKSLLLQSLQEKERIYLSPDVSMRGIDAGTQAIMQEDGGARVKNSGILADWIRVEDAFEKAIDGYMGELLPALVVRDIRDATEGMKLVKTIKAGSVKFLFGSQLIPKREEIKIPETIVASERFAGRLSDKVRCSDGIREVLEPMLMRCVVVRDIDSAREFFRDHPELDYVTLDGEVIRSGCLAMMRDSTVEGEGIMARKRKIGSIIKEIEKIGAEQIENERAVESLRSTMDAALNDENDIKEKIRTVEEELLELRHRAMNLSELLAHAAKKCQVLEEEISLVEEERRKLTSYMESGREVLSLKEKELEERENEVRLLKNELEAIRETLSEKGEELSSIHLELAEENKEIAVLDTDLAHLRESRNEAFERVNESHRNEAEWKETISELGEEIVCSGKVLEKLVLERKELCDRIEALRTEISSQKGSLQVMELELKERRSGLDGMRERLKERELLRVGLHSDMTHNAMNCREELGKEIEELASSVVLPSDAVEEILLQEIAELSDHIAKVGPINMMAMKEFDMLEERFKFLSAQKKDLTNSMESLQETIRKINRTSRERFLKAFEAIRQNFNETFKILFRGGKADLKLEEEQDVLESGLEIIAQPPGKRLQSISLMSGGEKALTAIALLFAVFRYQPSPFCLLDEADAALDDLNVERFLNLLKEFSNRTQFILITHNKKTMEIATILYGVTMEEPGISKVVSLKLN